MFFTILILLLSLAGLLAIAFYLRPFRLGIWFERWRLRSAKTKEKSIPVLGGRINYFEGGKVGETIVVLHGFMSHSGNWSTIARMLTFTHKCYFVDLLGHGKSKANSDRLSLQQVYDGFEVFMSKVVSESKVLLMGHSLGGWLAQMYALRHPDRVKRLILVNSTGLKQPVLKEVLLPATTEMAALKMQLLLGDRFAKLPRFFLKAVIKMNKPHFEYLFEDMQDGYFLDWKLKELKVPTLLIWGETDALLPMDYAQRLNKAISHSKLISIPQAAHAPQQTHGAAFWALLEKELGVEKVGRRR